MTFVPYVPPPAAPASPRVHELARRLSETISSFRRDYPDVTAAEVRQALGLAMRGLGTQSTPIAVALAVAMVLLGLVAVFVSRLPIGSVGPSLILPILVGVGIVALGLMVLLRIRGGSG